MYYVYVQRGDKSGKPSVKKLCGYRNPSRQMLNVKQDFHFWFFFLTLFTRSSLWLTLHWDESWGGLCKFQIYERHPTVIVYFRWEKYWPTVSSSVRCLRPLRDEELQTRARWGVSPPLIYLQQKGGQPETGQRDPGAERLWRRGRSAGGRRWGEECGWREGEGSEARARKSVTCVWHFSTFADEKQTEGGRWWGRRRAGGRGGRRRQCQRRRVLNRIQADGHACTKVLCMVVFPHQNCTQWSCAHINWIDWTFILFTVLLQAFLSVTQTHKLMKMSSCLFQGLEIWRSIHFSCFFLLLLLFLFEF